MARLLRRSFLVNVNQQDELELVVPRRYAPAFWPTMFTIAFLLAGLTGWSSMTRIPLTVEAKGVVLPIGGVREVVVGEAGHIVQRPVTTGDQVRAGQLLFRIREPGNLPGYDQARQRYHADMATILSERSAVEHEHRRNVAQLFLKITATRASRDERRRIEAEMEATLEVTQKHGELFEKGVISHREYVARMLEEQRIQLELRKIRDEIAQRDQEIIDAEGQVHQAAERRTVALSQLDGKELTARQTLLDAERRLWLAENVISQYDGEVIALKRAVGQTVAPSDQVALIDLRTQRQKLLLVASPSAVSGEIAVSLEDKTEKIAFTQGLSEAFASALLGALTKLIPDVEVSLEAFEDRIVIWTEGGGQAQLRKLRLSIAALEDFDGTPVFAHLQMIGDDWTRGEWVNLALIDSGDAKRIRPGAPVLVKPDSEKTLVGAQIEAQVRSVGDYVATSIEIEGLVGSSELARNLLGSQKGVVIIVGLLRDHDGSFLWRNGPPESSVSVGLTTSSLIQVETTSPVRVIVPYIFDLFT